MKIKFALLLLSSLAAIGCSRGETDSDTQAMKPKKEQAFTMFVSKELREICKENGGGKACDSASWDKAFYYEMKAELVKRKWTCQEGEAQICGPFSDKFIAQCFYEGGGDACLTNKWNGDLYRRIQKYFDENTTAQTAAK